MKIGNRLFELKKKQKISQETLAEKVGVSRQTISNWETDETVPDIYQAALLAQSLNISLDFLVCDDNSKNNTIKPIENINEMWKEIKQKLTEVISPASYEIWFEDLNEVSLNDKELIIYTNVTLEKDHITKHYIEHILNTISNLGYDINSVKIELKK